MISRRHASIFGQVVLWQVTSESHSVAHRATNASGHFQSFSDAWEHPQILGEIFSLKAIRIEKEHM